MPQTPLSGPSLADVQAAGFPMGGEPLAVDLADTLVTVPPEPADILSDDERARRFWELHAAQLPPGASPPGLGPTRQLRAAIRAALDAVQQHRAPDDAALAVINAASQAAPTSAAVERGASGLTRVEHEHTHDPQRSALAAAARSAIDVLTDPASALRRCASPTCSMLFVTGDARRRWCTPNVCGNRDRVARHYRRRRGADHDDAASAAG